MEDEVSPQVSSPSQLSKVSVKVPPFWKDNPVLWFRQLESQFINSGVTTPLTKYHTVVGHIETDVLAQVGDIIGDIPGSDAYQKLKTRLIEVFSASEQQRLKRLLTNIELGDRRPSALLKEMQELAGPLVGEQFLKSLWIQHLPPNIQGILVSLDLDLHQLASKADKISDVVTPAQLFSIQEKRSNSRSVEERLDELQRQVTDVTKKLEELCASRSRDRTYSRSHSPRPRSNRSTGRDICWYHSKFGTGASRCVEPCNYKPEN